MAIICFIIHGIGEQTSQYSLPLQRGVQGILNNLNVDSSNVHFHELYWANIGANDQSTLYRKLYSHDFAEKNSLKRLINAIFKYAPVRSLSVNLLGDVFGYLGQYQAPIKQAVFKEMHSKLTSLISGLKKDEPLSMILIGHSLGTIILHDLIVGCLTYKFLSFDKLIKHTSLITMGSPMSLFSLVCSRIDARSFYSWKNFVHDRDVISFPMNKLLDGVTDIYLKGWGWNPNKLHKQYWENPIIFNSIAETIKEHYEQKIGVTSLDSVALIPPEIFHPLVGDLDIAGLSQCFADFEKVPFDQLICNSTEIDFCNIYGGKWLERNMPHFIRALHKPHVKIRACFVSTKNPGLQGLSHHFSGKKIKVIKDEVRKATDKLLKAVTDVKKENVNAGRLQVYYVLNMVNHSFYRFDDVIYFTSRPLASSKHASAPIPCFAYRLTGKAGGAYEWIMRDFEELLKSSHDAVLHYDSAPDGSTTSPCNN